MLALVWTLCARACDEADLCLTAEVKGRAVGWLELHVPSAGHHAPVAGPPVDRLFATNLLVDASVRRCGIATSLLEYAEEVARDRYDVDEIIVSAVRDHVPSWNLFRKLGYQPIKAALAPKSASVLLVKCSSR